ncbi:putative short-chain dehydrogenases/reductases (SDR) family protein [Bosea sp. LC85]|uniref:SDR family NAD(P)-dependent oxidoreductase n=1 Tax=Bosea sp. LC85 TaxID=1502851 RepID=UPI0004E318A0|nr:SDR family NAD(P)-dependent oxidoreductase [Bosea sp. LC85]KFC74770.1 putative short-chain dehydrogenases/reductases (SDR) family protein [Bosea sp. LC85]
MERRDLLKAIALASSAGAASGLSLAAEAQAQTGKRGIGTRDIAPLSPDYFTPERFKGKTLIVTGCARGMGALAALRAAREGANVVGADWLEKQGSEHMNAIAKAGGNAEFVFGDISETETCEQMVKLAVARFGQLDYAINNAGVMDGVYSGAPFEYERQKHLLFAPIHEATDAYWDNVMRTNATGVFKSMRAELRQMVKQNLGGAIVNVGSVAGLTGFGGTPAYVASKHAVTGLTRSAAIDYAAYGIRINSVNMAQTATPMVERALELVTRKMQDAGGGPSMSMLKADSLLQAADSHKRDATPAEQVAIMLFLLSDEASNLTGGTYATDGGWTAY